MISHYYSKLRSMMDSQPIRFILVGGLNTVFGYTLFAILITAGLYYAYAMLLTTCIGVLVNFKFTGKLVFNNSDNRLLLKFIALYICIYFFNIILIHGLDLFLHNLYLSGIFSILASAVLSYFCNKNFIFVAKKGMLSPPNMGDQKTFTDTSATGWRNGE